MGYAVAFGTDLFRAAYGPGRELQIETAPFEPPAFDTRSNAEELTEETGRTYVRSNFTGGEGLDFAHDREERANKDSRFFDSRGVEILLPAGGVRREVVLSKKLELIDSNTTAAIRMAYDGTNLYALNSNTFFLRKTTNPTAASPTWADDDPHAGEVASFVWDVASLGTYTYAALRANGIHRYTGAAWAHWSDINANRVWSVKSRIIAASAASAGGALYEAVAGAVPTALYTLPTGRDWMDVIDAGAAILAAANDGYIYSFAVDEITGALELTGQTRVQGEKVMALAEAQGVVFYATSESVGGGTWIGRLWRSELAGDLTLTNGQLLREWNTTGRARDVLELAVSRDAVFMSVTHETSGSGGDIWRYDLTTGAMSRPLTAPGYAYGMLHFGGRLFTGAGGSGVWRQSLTNYETTGYVIGPLGDFFTSAVKSWVGARLDVDDLPSVADGRTVSFYYSTDPDALTNVNHSSWTLIATLDTESDITTAEYPLTGVESRYIAGKVVMTSSTAGTATPVVRSFGFRGLPGGGGGAANVDQMLSIPLNVSDQLERPNKRHVKVKGLGQRDIARLQALQGEALTMTLYHPGGSKQYRGQIESVGVPRHNPERGSATVYSMVKFRGREVVA